MTENPLLIHELMYQLQLHKKLLHVSGLSTYSKYVVSKHV